MRREDAGNDGNVIVEARALTREPSRKAERELGDVEGEYVSAT